MDETGFRVGCGVAHWVITMDAEKKLLLSDPDNREVLTACESISGGGVEILPNVDFEWCTYIGEMGSRK